MKKRLFAMFIALCMVTVFMPAATVFGADSTFYNSTNNTYADHVPTTYRVGSGYDSGLGAKCYEGPSIDTIEKILLYKGDIIEFVPDSPLAGGGKRTVGLFKGFKLNTNSVDVVAQYAKVIDSYSAPNGVIYQKIEITSDVIFYLNYKGAGPTGEDTYDIGETSYTNRVYYYTLTAFQPDTTTVTYDYDGGTYKGTAIPPEKLVVSLTDYQFELPVLTKPGYKFVGWESPDPAVGRNPIRSISGTVCNVRDCGTPYYEHENTFFASNTTVKAVFEEGPEAQALLKLIKGINQTKITSLKAKATRGKVTLTYAKSPGYKIDGYYIYKSTKKTSGFKYVGKTTAKKFTSKKSLVKGKTYYYKVKGYRVIDGTKVYTNARTVKVVAK